jgi:uncharacterized protein YggT (Ycf19 family)
VARASDARPFCGSVRAMPLVITALNALRLLIVADALFSWTLKENQLPRSFTKALLDPIYAPLRRVLHPLTGSVDLAPLVALGALYVLQVVIERGRKRPES